MPRLLQAAPRATVHCLVRARDAAALERRAAELVSDPRLPAGAAARVRVVAGDTRAPDLGLGERRAELCAGTRAVVHAAASTRFDLELDEARAQNVAGTRHVLRFSLLLLVTIAVFLLGIILVASPFVGLRYWRRRRITS